MSSIIENTSDRQSNTKSKTTSKATSTSKQKNTHNHLTPPMDSKVNNKTHQTNKTIEGDNDPMESLNDETVTRYLMENPLFFQQHEELLEQLTIPHCNTGIAVSLIEKQVSLLRNQKNSLNTQLKNLIQAARNNEQIINRMQRFTLDIIHAHSVEDIIVLCQEEMHNNFNADYVGIKLIASPNTDNHYNHHHHDNNAIFVASDDSLLRSFHPLFKNRKPLCGRITQKQRQLMFPNHVDNIHSAVLAPLQNTDNIGIIALGSADEFRFQAGMGTLFISHLAEIITASLSKHLK